MRIPGCAFLLLALLLTAGCRSRDPRFSDETIYMGGYRRNPQPQRANFDNVSYWDGDAVAGSPSVKISLSEQKAFFFFAGFSAGAGFVAAAGAAADLAGSALFVSVGAESSLAEVL